METNREPTLRVRVTHKQTAKGWRVDETTVEMTAEDRAGGFDHISQTMKYLMYAAHQDGLEEARRRNSQEGYDG